MVCDHACTASCLCIGLYVEMCMTLNLTGLHTGTYHRLYALELGEDIDVPTLGGDTTELEARLSSVETALPPKAEQSTLTTIHDELLGSVGEKASSQALAVAQSTLQRNNEQKADASAVSTLQSALQASIDTQAVVGNANSIQARVDNAVVATDTCLLDPNTKQLLDTSGEMPIILYRVPIQHSVTIQTRPIWQLAHVVNLGDNTTLSEYGAGLNVTPARNRLGKIVLCSEQGALRSQQAPYGSNDPTWKQTTRSVTSSEDVGIGKGVPRDGDRLHVLGEVLFNNLTCALLKAIDLLFQDGGYLSERLSAGPSWTTFRSVTSHTIILSGGTFQEHCVYLENDPPSPSIVMATQSDEH